MAAKWISYFCVAVTLALVMGCRTPQPVIKPDKKPEVITDPPQEARYDTSSYPKQAFDAPTRPTDLDKSLLGNAGGMGGMGGRGMGGGSGGMAGR